jgi:uncharacterized membrane protein YphA (DoxX/SURF4 family)
MGAFRRSLSMNFGPLLLRVAIGATFLWAGWPKIMVKDAFPPEALATLANLGVDRAQRAATGAPGAPAAPGAPSNPDGALPDPSSDRGEHRVILAQSGAGAPARVYSSGDFAGPVELSRLHHVAIGLHAQSVGDKPVWPKALGSDPWAIRLAYAVAWTELLAGAFVLIGLFTPLSAFAIACVMGGAMWLTQIGPATIGGGPSFLGFLPPLENFAPNPMGWQTFILQLTLFAAAVSLMFSGAGAISVDRWIFGSRKGDGSSGEGRASYNSDDDDAEDEDE